MIGSTKYTTVSEVEKTFSSRKYIFYFVIIILSFFIFNILYTAKNDANIRKKVETKKEIEKLFEDLKDNELFEQLEIINKNNDLEGLLEEEHQYIAKAKVRMNINKYIYNREAIVIEVFNNQKDMELRKNYLMARNEYLEELYGNDYGYLPNILELPTICNIYSRGKALMLIDPSMGGSKIWDYQNLFYQLADKIDNKEIFIPSSNTIDKIKADNDQRLLAWKRKNVNVEEILTSLEELKNKMSKRVEIAYASNNNVFITNVLDELKYYNVRKYQKEYTLWNDQLTKAKQSLDEGILLPDMIEKHDRYKQTIYKDGEYVVGVDIIPGEYVLIKNKDAEKAEVVIGYNEHNPYIFEGAIKIEGNTIIKIGINSNGDPFYKNVSLTGATMYHIDNSPQLELKSPGTFKVGKHIEPGEYEMIASTYTKSYLISNFIGVLDYHILTDPFIVSVETVTKTLKEGEYLVLLDERVQIKKK